MPTSTKPRTLQDVLQDANPQNLADAVRKTNANAFKVITVTFAALADVAAHDITTAASKAGITALAGVDALADGEMLPAIGQVVSLRSTAGTIAVQGAHVMADAGGTALVPNAAHAGVALLSADGKTVTFQAGVTAFVLSYVPRSATALTDVFAPYPS